MGVLDAQNFIRTHGPERYSGPCVCMFLQKPTRPGILIPGLASMVMPPLPTALKGYLAHVNSIAPKQEKLKHFV